MRPEAMDYVNKGHYLTPPSCGDYTALPKNAMASWGHIFSQLLLLLLHIHNEPLDFTSSDSSLCYKFSLKLTSTTGFIVESN